jgi:hypothetical protein
MRKSWRRDVGAEDWLLAANRPPAEPWAGVAFAGARQLAFASPVDGRTIWEADVGGKSQWSAYASSGLVVAAGGRLLCLGYDSGNVVWEFPPRSAVPTTVESPPASAFAVTGGLAFFIESRRRLRCLDLETGELQWEASFGEEILAPKVQAIDSNVYVASPNRFYGLESTTGRRRVDLPIRGGVETTPAVFGAPHLFFVSDRSIVAAVDPTEGRIVWEQKFIWPTQAPPRLYYSSGGLTVLIDGYQLVRLDLGTGRPLWRCAIGARPMREGTIEGAAAGDRFFSSLEGWLECRRLKDGSLDWRRPAASPDAAMQLRAVDGRIVACASQGKWSELSLWEADGRVEEQLTFEDLDGPAKLDWADAFAVLSAGKRRWMLEIEPDRAASPGESQPRSDHD